MPPGRSDPSLRLKESPPWLTFWGEGSSGTGTSWQHAASDDMARAGIGEPAASSAPSLRCCTGELLRSEKLGGKLVGEPAGAAASVAHEATDAPPLDARELL